MGQKGNMMGQKGLKTYEKRQKIEFLDLKNLPFSGFFLTGIRGYPPPPLNGKSSCPKTLSLNGGYPPPLTKKNAKYFWSGSLIELYQNQMSGHKTRQVVLRLLPLTFSCRVLDSKVPGPREPIPPTLLLLARCCHRSRTSETWTCGLKRTTVNLTLGRKEITIKIRMKRRRIFCTSAQCQTNIV